MRLQTLLLNGFKSFHKKTILEFSDSIVCIVGPNGSGKSNVVEALRYVLGEQSMKSLRGKIGLDLIFQGSKGLPRGSRATVSVSFDNKDKVFRLGSDDGEDINLNYDTINISREVGLDGSNKYILNGTEVRLKDIHNLLASVNIGSSGHHIISQGEADRILNANPRERREMVEDALGLKIYQFKIKESERKLERTTENMKEVTMLRRENAPHLKFLKKQVEKFEKAKNMQSELSSLYLEYFQKENHYLDQEDKKLSTERNDLSKELAELARKISADPENDSKTGNQKISELREVEQGLNNFRSKKSEMERELGRLEGKLESRESRVELSDKCPLCGSEIKKTDGGQENKIKNAQQELVELRDSKDKLLSEIQKLDKEEQAALTKAEGLKKEINKEAEALHELEKERFKFKVRHQELSSALELVELKEETLRKRKESFENETKEGVALIGAEVMNYKQHTGADSDSGLSQEELRKRIERIKIKLEDVGLGSGTEVTKEFQQVSERDAFLTKEMEDLTKSIESLKKIIVDLKEKIDTEFKEGVKKINTEFQEFFSLMFGGGKGSLSIVTPQKRKKNADDLDEDSGEFEEEVIPERGIEINVSLPQKKVKELHALSGGERSLTSIALLFAMSQVNPPPFLVLDETDAALDEANSRKYGDMLEKLSAHSQLVVVTHNRETMMRAGTLYGVTIGSDGASKLLSVKFEEAAQIAK